jgi:hypothetical protein
MYKLCYGYRFCLFLRFFYWVLELFRQLRYSRNNYKIYDTVGTIPKYTILSEQFQNLRYCRNNSKIYDTVGTIPQSTILSEQLQNIRYCRNNSKIYDTVGTIPKYTTLSVKQSPHLKGHIFLVLSYKISYKLNLF